MVRQPCEVAVYHYFQFAGSGGRRDVCMEWSWNQATLQYTWLWTQKKQRDFFLCESKFRSCVTVPAEPRLGWLGNRAVRGDLSAGLTSWMREPPAWAWGCQGASTTNSHSLSQMHPLSGDPGDQVAHPRCRLWLLGDIVMTAAWRRVVMGTQQKNLMISYYWPCIWKR